MDKQNSNQIPLVDNNTNVKERSIVDEMKQSYINYAMSVIVARALPDVRDGLKPVQRRILYTLQKLGITPGSSYKKVARIVGETMGKYHPHGNDSISDALVRMAQEFTFRYPLVDGQGNFGSIDGDPAAAMRYIEARMHKNGAQMLTDLNEYVVDFIENYDGNEVEPTVLPTVLPNLLVNGNEGIAVGMATKIPPHNLGEVVDATVDVINYGNSWNDTTSKILNVNYEHDIKKISDIEKLPKDRFYKFETEINTDRILEYIKGPDFPTRAEMYDKTEIDQVYKTGRGRILMRAVSEIEEMKNNRFRIIITEIPYQVVKSRLLEKIAKLHRDKKIDGISDLRDESNKKGIRIVIELKRDAKPKTVENQLFKYTELQKAYNANMLALVNGEPKLLTIKQILEQFISHRQTIVIRRNEYKLAKLREREHILEGLMIALENIDEIISTIRKAKDADIAKVNLIKKFKLSEIQAQAILDMQLRRLAALERHKIEQEYKEIIKSINNTLNILNTPDRVLKIISKELLDLKEKFGDARRTKLFKGKVGEFNEKDLVPKEQTFVTISEKGYIKRVKYDSYKAQRRGGIGKKAMTTKTDDQVRHVFNCNTHDEILFFTNQGKVYSLKVYEIPEYGRTAKGIPVINLLNISQGELVTSVLTRSNDGLFLDEDVHQEGEESSEMKGKAYEFLFMTTKYGVVKKTALEQFENIRSNGLIAINLDDNDELIWVKPVTGDSEIILVTECAKSIHFHETDVRKTGRTARGVRGIRLKSNDVVISMDVIRKKENMMLTISENGFGKTTKLEQFTLQKRGGKGIFAHRVNKKTGNLTAARILDHPQLDLLIISANGMAVRIPTNNLPERSRQTSGVRMMRVKSGDTVAAIAII